MRPQQKLRFPVFARDKGHRVAPQGEQIPRIVGRSAETENGGWREGSEPPPGVTRKTQLPALALERQREDVAAEAGAELRRALRQRVVLVVEGAVRQPVARVHQR